MTYMYIVWVMPLIVHIHVIDFREAGMGNHPFPPCWILSPQDFFGLKFGEGGGEQGSYNV